MTPQTVASRVERLEELMAELTMNVNRLSLEMREFKNEMRRETRNLRQTIAEQSRKMGTLAEDLVAPSVSRILSEVVGCPEEPRMIGVRIRRALPGGRHKEYDVVAVCGDYLFINETKTRLQPEDVKDFIETLEESRDFLSEYKDKQVIGSLASFYVDPSLVLNGERQGIIVLGVVDGLMQVLNREGFRPKAY